MPHLIQTIDAVRARCDRLQKIIENEPEFSNWHTSDVGNHLYIVFLFPKPGLTVDEAEASAKALMSAFGGEWSKDEGTETYARWEELQLGVYINVPKSDAIAASANPLIF